MEKRWIGHYEVRRELGRGGMGVVYAAYDPGLAREVAVKVLLDVDNQTALTRFQREARLLGRLDHPGLVRVMDFGVDQGRAYLVMDLIEGDSLGARLKRSGALPPSEATHVVLELAKTLKAVHEAGVLHRDLKPDNVLQRQRDGAVLLTDFGVARSTADERERLTRTGHVLGSPSYMSPEQASGEPVDVRTDVYGLGATLSTLLTGQPLYSGLSTVNALNAVLTKPPPRPSAIVPGLDPRIDAICLRCLAKDPAERYANMGEVIEALTALEEAPAARGGGLFALAGLGLLAVVLVAAGVVAALGEGPTSSPAPAGSALTRASPRPSAEPAPSPAPELPLRPTRWHYAQGPRRPPAREGHEAAFVYVPSLEKVVFFGGHDNREKPRGRGEPMEQWGWDGRTWSKIRSRGRAPGWRFGHAAAYDAARDVVVVYGGSFLLEQHGKHVMLARESAHWEWDPKTRAWTDRIFRANESPGLRSWHALVPDPKRGRLLLYGGLYGNLRSDLWAWKGGRWELLDEGKALPPRQSVGMAVLGDEVVVAGGWFGGKRFDDRTWLWSAERGWRAFDPGEQESPLGRQSATLSAFPGGALLFGGKRQGLHNDTWLFTAEGWRKQELEGAPPPRLWHGAAWDPKRETLVIYGGHYKGRSSDETWELPFERAEPR